MPPLPMLTSVALMRLVAVVIPGPNFVLVARIAAVAGIGLGSAVCGFAGIFVRLGRPIDRLAGAVFIGFGAKLVLDRA